MSLSLVYDVFRKSENLASSTALTSVDTSSISSILSSINSKVSSVVSGVSSVTSSSGGNYSGDVLGTVKPASGCGACGPAVQDKSKCSDFGSEWSYNGYGSCGTCRFNCVSFGLLGTACTTGTHANCKKTQYTGQASQCCLGQQPTGYPNVTCDPAYTPLSSNCSSTVQNYCSSGNRIFTDSMCISWAAQNPTQANVIKKSYCKPGIIPTDASCRSWIASSDTQGTIDDVMVSNYCQNNLKDDLCSCVMSEIPCPNKFDSNCIQKGGYKTKDMMTVTCPNVLNCTQFLALSPGAQSIATNVEQNCTSNTNPPPSGSGNTDNTDTSSTDIKTKLTDLWTKYKYVIMVFLFIFIIIIAISFAIPSNEEPNNSNIN